MFGEEGREAGLRKMRGKSRGDLPLIDEDNSKLSELEGRMSRRRREEEIRG